MSSQSDAANERAVLHASPGNESAAGRGVVVPAALGAHPILRSLGLAGDGRSASDTPDAFDASEASDPSGQPGAFVIGETDGALDLRPPGEAARRGIQAVFPPDAHGSSTARRGPKAHPLVRAFGRRPIEIVDLTAGLGADAYRLAAAGHRVRGCERDPVVFALLASGWARARERGLVPVELAARLRFVHAEGADQLDSIEALDVGVYLDPMYPPPRRRSARPRRELQVLRAWLGGQTDAAALVERARARAARVVVKRPHHADPLVPGRSFEVETKLVRFDVYMNPQRMQANEQGEEHG